MRRRGALVAVLALTALAGCATGPAQAPVRVGDAEFAVARRGSGTPTVVFQAGLGDGLATWSALWERLPPALPLFAYDRPGYGASPATAAPRDACSIASELHALLRAAGVPPPYLLVGHSLGGSHQAAFARLYPQDVAAVLLLDATHPEHWATMQREAPGMAAVVNTLRLTTFSAAMRREFDDQAACNARLAALPPPRVPARLLVRTRHDAIESADFRRMAATLQQRWLADWPGLALQAVEGSGHYIQKDRPEAVLEAIEALRTEAAAR